MSKSKGILVLEALASKGLVSSPNGGQKLVVSQLDALPEGGMNTAEEVRSALRFGLLPGDKFEGTIMVSPEKAEQLSDLVPKATKIVWAPKFKTGVSRGGKSFKYADNLSLPSVETGL